MAGWRAPEWPGARSAIGRRSGHMAPAVIEAATASPGTVSIPDYPGTGPNRVDRAEGPDTTIPQPASHRFYRCGTANDDSARESGDAQHGQANHLAQASWRARRGRAAAAVRRLGAGGAGRDGCR